VERRGDPYLETGDVRIDERDVELLRGIDEHGSIHHAASELGRSYARMQQRVVELEEAVGPLVVRTRGGAGGGGSRLTEDARDLLARFERLRTAFSGIAVVEETVLPGTVRDREGELATVETPAGTLRTLCPPGATAVEVAIRADAVTLYAPSEAPPEGGTSARNRLHGTVSAVHRGDAVARVAVDVGLEAPLSALVTTDSVERLGLAAGVEVVATFKATATRATPSG
jgi:molybdate transport system regulatory protein